MKECSRCKNKLEIHLFNKRLSSKDGLRSECRQCQKEQHIINKNCINKQRLQFRKNNKQRLNETSKEYYCKNKDAKKNYDNIYYHNNKSKIIYRHNQSNKSKRKTNPLFRLKCNVSSAINKLLKNNNGSKCGNSILKYLPYSIEDLRNHLENNFKPWMNWNNYGSYLINKWNDQDEYTWTWQIDHTVPQSSLPYQNMNDDNFKRCWSLDNLRPYSSKENLLEGVKRIRHI